MANDLARALQMEVRSETPCRKDFDFTVPAAAIAREADRTARDFALSVNIPGFRRGKAPVSMLKSRFADLPRIRYFSRKGENSSSLKEMISSYPKREVSLCSFALQALR